MGEFAARFRDNFVLREGGVALEVEQEPAGSLSHASLDTGCTVWPAAAALARAVLAPGGSAAGAALGARVVELGAGTGLAGLACAAAGARSVLMTDLPARMPLLARNLRRNGWVRTLGGCGSLEAAPLDWADARGALRADARLRDADATLLVGSDLVHDVSQCAPLAACVAELLAAWPRCVGLLWAQTPHCALATAELRGRLEREAGLVFERRGGFEGGGELLLGVRSGAAVGAAGGARVGADGEGADGPRAAPPPAAVSPTGALAGAPHAVEAAPAPTGAPE